MNTLSLILHNLCLVSPVCAWMLAQILKFLITLLTQKTMKLERLTGSGGMPSSHSATVCALTTAAGLRFGPSSFEFAISGIMSLIVMYDACGVRMEAGRHATLLKELGRRAHDAGNPLPEVKGSLHELLGHTKLQVFFGALLGIAVGGCAYAILY